MICPKHGHNPPSCDEPHPQHPARRVFFEPKPPPRHKIVGSAGNNQRILLEAVTGSIERRYSGVVPVQARRITFGEDGQYPRGSGLPFASGGILV